MIGNFWIKSTIFNLPIILLHRYMYACMVIFNQPKHVLHYFAKYYFHQYFVLNGILGVVASSLSSSYSPCKAGSYAEDESGM